MKNSNKAKILGEEFVYSTIVDTPDGNSEIIEGLTKKEYFFGIALNGLLSKGQYSEVSLEQERIQKTVDIALAYTKASLISLADDED